MPSSPRGKHQLNAKSWSLSLLTVAVWGALVGDADLVAVAIANLVDNALSFSEAGGQVVVSLDSDGVLSVRDHGPGIPESRLDVLFEPFVRFPPSRNGHGLGLAIVRAVATAHGAGLRAENAEGGGAVFTLDFRNAEKPSPAA